MLEVRALPVACAPEKDGLPHTSEMWSAAVVVVVFGIVVVETQTSDLMTRILVNAQLFHRQSKCLDREGQARGPREYRGTSLALHKMMTPARRIGNFGDGS